MLTPGNAWLLHLPSAPAPGPHTAPNLIKAQLPATTTGAIEFTTRIMPTLPRAR